MLKPVSILSLDEASTPLVQAVQQRIAKSMGLDDLVQCRDVATSPLADAIQSIYAQRQHPDSPLRVRDDISTRELVLLVLSSCGPARTTLLDAVQQIRNHYDSRHLAKYYTIEILCLMPEVVGASKTEDYAHAFGLLKALSADDAKPFDEVWLLDATNGSRVRFGALDTALDAYADAVAGALTFEPEMSGALPGIHPRGMHPTFSSFGYSELSFPREVALQRIEPRFAAELVHTQLLGGEPSTHAQLGAKQFVARDEFAMPLTRIGVDAGQSLFRKFQPRTHVTEHTRSADELIAAVRAELKTFRDSTHLQNLETLAKQGDATSRELATLLQRTIDESLDRDGYDATLQLLDVLLDPLPDLRDDAELAPRNLVTELGVATSALDTRLHFLPNTHGSDAARKRIRELTTLIDDQQLVADTLAPANATNDIGAMREEKASLLQQVPELLFNEERENNAARAAARDAEAKRLGEDTTTREQELRELFEQKPRAERALAEALEMRRSWLWTQTIIAIAGVAVIYAMSFAQPVLALLKLFNITVAALIALAIFGIVTAFRYAKLIAPIVRAARERVEWIAKQIDAVDQAKNAAHNAELQFEYDMTHRRTSLRVLREVREVAKTTLESVRMRRRELVEIAASFVPASIATKGMSLSIIDDAEVDAWYARTTDDRKPFVREFPISRSASRALELEELRMRITTYAATVFDDFRKLTLATAATSVASEPKLSQRMKRFTDSSAPLMEVRDDDLPAQKAMQRDATLWIETSDEIWLRQLQRRFTDAHVKATGDPLRIHAITRVLHYPGYLLGQIEHYRAQYDAVEPREFADAPDLLPLEMLVSPQIRTAYEQVLLGRAVGVISLREDGQLFACDATLGTTHFAAAQRIAGTASLRTSLDAAVDARIEIARERLLEFHETTVLTEFDRTVLEGLMRRWE